LTGGVHTFRGRNSSSRQTNKSLAYLNEQSLQSELQRKAMTRLIGLQFKIVYKKGKENKAADALSRIPAIMTIQS
jgi:hypothetical protein